LVVQGIDCMFSSLQFNTLLNARSSEVVGMLESVK